MEKKDLRIVYMGTPDFAVEGLRRLVEDGYNVVGVVTMPDKPTGRHQNILQPSAVKKYAIEQGLPVLQPERLKDELFLERLKGLEADLQIVVAFRMLPEVVWQMPPMGTFNLHASLLPKYRGAAPINWAIIRGEKETGVTTFFLKHDIDTGDVLGQRKLSINEQDDAGIIHDRLMKIGGDLLLDTVAAILRGSASPTAQRPLPPGDPASSAPKIFKETCRIDWNHPIEEIYNFIRGLAPYPSAWTELYNGKEQHVIKIFSTEKIITLHQKPHGSVEYDEKGNLLIAVDGGYISVRELQMAGKKRMPIEDFLRGFHLLGHTHVE